MRFAITYSLFFIVTFSTTCLFGQSPKAVLIKNAYLHVGNGDVIPSATIGMKDGKIALIKNSLAYTINTSEWDTIIDAQGKHVYPGFVAPNTTLGITEIDAVRATRDFQETGIYNPHVRSQIAYNAESEIIRTVRANGVLLTQPTPRGGSISGTSSIMALSGWNWEDATIAANDGIHVNWPESIQRSKENRMVQEKSTSYQEKKQQLYTFFGSAKAYAQNEKGKKDLRFDAMKACFNGTKRVYIHADNLQQINDIIEFAAYFKLPFPVIVGGYDAHLVARKLKDAKIPVMLYRTHSLPKREDDAINQPYATAAKLQEEGVLFCLQNEGDMEAMNARNLPFLAGTAFAYGLTEEQAVMAITLNTCKILGIDQRYGSIEVGKSATLFISLGNALDMRTSKVELAFINGLLIDLNDKQKELYQKYKRKYKR